MNRLAALAFVATTLWASAADAQTAFRRGWLDVNFGGAVAAQKSFEMNEVVPDLGGEVKQARARYHLPSGASFDIGGGAMITRTFGLGVSLTGTAHQKAADLAISIPHPLYFNAYASDATATDQALMRSEGGFNIQAMVVAVDQGNLRLRVFGGPTFFRVEQEGVSLIRYSQSYGLFSLSNTVRITTYQGETVEGTGWGAHVGADVTYFFGRVFGVGGIVRYARGIVNIEDTLGGGTIEVKAGGVQVAGGVRFRF